MLYSFHSVHMYILIAPGCDTLAEGKKEEKNNTKVKIYKKKQKIILKLLDLH